MATKTIEVGRCRNCPMKEFKDEHQSPYYCKALKIQLTWEEAMSKTVPLRCPLLGGRIEIVNAFPQTEIEDVKVGDQIPNSDRSG